MSASALRGFAVAAPALLNAGWMAMPLPAGEKWPPPKGLTGRTEPAREAASSIEIWAAKAVTPYLNDDAYADANTGIRLPADMIVLDVDHYPQRGKRGDQALKEFQATRELDDLPPTVVITPRGYKSKSGHRLYRIHPDAAEAINDGSRSLPSQLCPDVDLLFHGYRYSVEGGSLHPSGSVYRVYDERGDRPERSLKEGLSQVAPADIPMLPDDWLTAVLTLSPRLQSGDGEAFGLDGEGVGPAAPSNESERRRAKGEMAQWLSEHGAPEVDLAYHDLLSALSPSARKALREFDSPQRNNANVAQACIHFLATLMEDMEIATRTGADPVPVVAALESAKANYTRHGDSLRRPAEFDRALVWAFPLAKQATQNVGAAADVLSWANRVVADEFWSQSAVLRSARDFARSRLVSPDALLACSLVLVASWTPPHLTLPGIVGGEASLNFYVALCAASGGGKSSAMAAAKDWLRIVPHGASDLETDTPLTTTIATGEGLLGAFTTSIPKQKGATVRLGQLDFIQHRRSVRFEVDEIQSLGATMSRESSTLRSFLKQMWTGSAPSTLAADAARTRKLDDHSFRATVVAGVQPASADVLLSDSEGGFPQRWLWVDTYDDGKLSLEELDKCLEAPPEPYTWTPPRACYPLPLPPKPRAEGAGAENDEHYVSPFVTGRHTDGPHEVVDITRSLYTKVVLAAQQGRALGQTTGSMTQKLDRHGVLLEEKIAALLAQLHGEVSINEAYERMAEWVKARSDATREAILAERWESERISADAKAVRQGMSAAIAAESQGQTTHERAVQRVLGVLDGAGQSVKFRQLSRSAHLERVAPTADEQREFLETIPGVSIKDGLVTYDQDKDGGE